MLNIMRLCLGTIARLFCARREGNAVRQTSLRWFRPCSFSCATWGAAPWLRSSCLFRTDVASSKERGSSILIYMRSSCGRSPQERISRPVVPSGSSLPAVVLANRTISGADRVLAKHRWNRTTEIPVTITEGDLAVAISNLTESEERGTPCFHVG